MSSKAVGLSQTQTLFAEQRIEFQTRIIRSGHWSTCINCDFWSENAKGPAAKGEEICMKFNARPPVHIIVTGCPEYIEDIPF